MTDEEKDKQIRLLELRILELGKAYSSHVSRIDELERAYIEYIESQGHTDLLPTEVICNLIKLAHATIAIFSSRPPKL